MMDQHPLRKTQALSTNRPYPTSGLSSTEARTAAHHRHRARDEGSALQSPGALGVRLNSSGASGLHVVLVEQLRRSSNFEVVRQTAIAEQEGRLDYVVELDYEDYQRCLRGKETWDVPLIWHPRCPLDPSTKRPYDASRRAAALTYVAKQLVKGHVGVIRAFHLCLEGFKGSSPDTVNFLELFFLCL